jgi:hypothetical protein
MSKQTDRDALDALQIKLKIHIEKNFETIEAFCWENDLPKSTISNFFSNKYDFKYQLYKKLLWQ